MHIHEKVVQMHVSDIKNFFMRNHILFQICHNGLHQYNSSTSVQYIKEMLFSHFKFSHTFRVILNMDIISCYYNSFLVTRHLMVYSYPLYSVYISWKCNLHRQLNEHYQSHHHNNQLPTDQFVMNRPDVDPTSR